MIDPANRDALEDLMTRYVLGELGGDEARELASLVEQRPELRIEIGRLQRSLGLLPYAVVTEPPPHLRARVLEAARHAAIPRRRVPSVSIARLVGSIAAVLIVALAWDGYRLRQELQLQRDVATTLQQPNVVHQFALHGTGISRAAGSAVLDLDAKRAALVIRGLPSLPPGHVFRLWARVGDGAVRCGDFTADADGAVVSQFTIPVDAYTSPVRELFLNVEPSESGPEPVGPTVMTSA